MKALLLSLPLALALAACASSPSYGDHRPQGSSLLQRAYDLGSEHASLRYCAATVGATALRVNWESAQAVVAGYPPHLQRAAQAAFDAGVVEGGGFSSPHRVACDELRPRVNAYAVRNYDAAAALLRQGGGHAPKHSGLPSVR